MCLYSFWFETLRFLPGTRKCLAIWYILDNKSDCNGINCQVVTNTLDFPDRRLGKEKETNKRIVMLKVGQWEDSNDQRGDRVDLLLKSQTVASLGTGQTSYKINFLSQQTHLIKFSWKRNDNLAWNNLLNIEP